MVSNALGAFFQKYLSNYDGSVIEALESFFDLIGVVDNPIKVSPIELPDNERTNPSQNKSYNPKYTISKRNSDMDRAIVLFILRNTNPPRKGEKEN